MAIAKMIVGDDYLNDTYNYNDYLNTLSRINRLGFYVTPETGALAGYVYDDHDCDDPGESGGIPFLCERS